MLRAAERSWLLFAAPRVVELNEARLEVLELADRAAPGEDDWEREALRLRTCLLVRLDGLKDILDLAWLLGGSRY